MLLKKILLSLIINDYCKKYIKNVVLTVVDQVEDQPEIDACRKICQEKDVALRVRPYEES